MRPVLDLERIPFVLCSTANRSCSGAVGRLHICDDNLQPEGAAFFGQFWRLRFGYGHPPPHDLRLQLHERNATCGCSGGLVHCAGA